MPLCDDEVVTSGEIVELLLHEQLPEMAALPLGPLSNTGSDNALYRLGRSLWFACRALQMPPED